jgi:hypothetical protein
VKAKKRLVVYPGRERYRIDLKTEVLPLAALIEDLSRRRP